MQSSVRSWPYGQVSESLSLSLSLSFSLSPSNSLSLPLFSLSSINLTFRTILLVNYKEMDPECIRTPGPANQQEQAYPETTFILNINSPKVSFPRIVILKLCNL